MEDNKLNYDLKERHADLVSRLKKSGYDIMADITPLKLELMHMSMLLASEAGELVDSIKKHVLYNRELDHENILEELGDIEFALEGFRQLLSLSREEILVGNLEKLNKRYPKGTYSDEDAKNRADKI